MKVEQQVYDVQRQGVDKGSQFNIKAHPAAFDTLSTSLYSDKIAAIIRELSCNAYDSHVDASKESEPFYIKLPNALEPWFLIRDYGTGLCHEDILELYSNYFSSNKTDSNLFTGCLGLGSKTPFAYTDSFSVISYYKGTKNTYVAYRDEDGYPRISLLNSEDTNETNGLEISFAVNRPDFHDFTTKASKILSYFKKKPTVKGNSKFSFPEKKVEIEEKDWKIYSRTFWTSGPKAIMGNVAYPINLDKAKADKDLRKIFHELPIEIDFAIGELNVTPSREELHYSENTQIAIQQKLHKIKKDLENLLWQKTKNASNFWEASVEAAKFSRYLRANLESFEIYYNGKKVTSYLRFDGYVRKYRVDRKMGRAGSLSAPDPYVVDWIYISQESIESLLNSYNKNDLLVIYNDTDKTINGKISDYLKGQMKLNQAPHTTLVIDAVPKNDGYDDETKKKDLDTLGVKNYKLASQFFNWSHKPKAQKKTYTKNKIYKLNTTTHMPTVSQQWEWCFEDLTKIKGYYVYFNRHLASLNQADFFDKKECTPFYLVDIAEMIDLMKRGKRNPDFEIYGIKPEHAKKVQNNPNFKPLEDELQNLKAYLKSSGLTKINKKDIGTVLRNEEYLSGLLEVLKKNKPDLVKKDIFLKEVEKLLDVIKPNKNIAKIYVQYARSFGGKDTVLKDSLAKNLHQFEDKYDLCSTYNPKKNARRYIAGQIELK